MAIIDAIGELSDAQPITSTDVSTDKVYWGGIVDKTVGVADGLYLNVRCNTTFDSANDTATLTIALVHDSDSALGSPTVIYQTPAFAVDSAQLTAWNGKGNGDILCMRLPDDVDEEEYVGLNYTVAVQSFSAGKIDAWIGPPAESNYNTQVASSNVT